jgi:hypothetical protein
MHTEIDLAWLAGFVDGEGTFTIAHYKTGRSTPYRPTFSLCNTKIEAIENARRIISSVLGRNVKYVALKDKRGYRPCHQIAIGALGEVKLISQALLPYLVGKREQAEIMLKFIAITPGQRTHQKHDERGYFISASQYDERHSSLVSRMRFLNKRYSREEWATLQRETELPAPRYAGEETIRSVWQHAESDRNDLAAELVAQ